MSRSDTILKYFREQKDFMDRRVNYGIETYRKGDANITLKMKDGSAVPEGVTIDAKLTNHEFRFGCNIFMLDELETQEKNDIYKEKFPECFNLATVPFYWKDVEPERGKPRYAADSYKIYRRPAPDLCVNYCKEKGIEPKCHCLNYDSWAPDWVLNMTVQEHKAALEKRFRELSERYAEDIPTWEVTNETLRNAFTKFFYEDDFVEWSFRMADRYFPNNRLIINDYNLWNPGNYTNRNMYYMQIERLLKNGITHLDSIGMQYHTFIAREGEAELAQIRYNPENVYKLLDLYAKFGLAEQITEMTLSAYSNEEEDEYVQAEVLKNLYAIFFSHPNMEAVIYWNLVDGYAAWAPQGDMAVGENQYFGGLLRFDMSEKPAYKELKRLVNEEWHTELTVPAVDGKAAFRGFYGDYELNVHVGDKVIPVKTKLSKSAANNIVIEL